MLQQFCEELLVICMWTAFSFIENDSIATERNTEISRVRHAAFKHQNVCASVCVGAVSVAFHSQHRFTARMTDGVGC